MEDGANVIEFARKDLKHLLGTGKLSVVDERTQQALIKEVRALEIRRTTATRFARRCHFLVANSRSSQFLKGGWRSGRAPAAAPDSAYAEALERFRQAMSEEDRHVTAENNRIHAERERIENHNAGIPNRIRERAVERQKRMVAKSKRQQHHWLESWKPPKGFEKNPESWKCLNLEVRDGTKRCE